MYVGISMSAIPESHEMLPTKCIVAALRKMVSAPVVISFCIFEGSLILTPKTQ